MAQEKKVDEVVSNQYFAPYMPPKATIRVWAEEKINVGNFSNVTIGAEVTRPVDNEDEVIDAELRETLHKRIEKFLADERDELLESLTKTS